MWVGATVLLSDVSGYGAGYERITLGPNRGLRGSIGVSSVNVQLYTVGRSCQVKHTIPLHPENRVGSYPVLGICSSSSLATASCPALALRAYVAGMDGDFQRPACCNSTRLAPRSARLWAATVRPLCPEYLSISPAARAAARMRWDIWRAQSPKSGISGV